MKRRTLVLSATATQFVIPCPAGHEVRLVNVNFQQAVGSGFPSILSMSQGNLLLCQLITPCGGASTGLVNFGVKLPAVGAEATNIDQVTGTVTFNPNNIQVQGTLPDVWFGQEIRVSVPGSATVVTALYELRSV